MLKKDQTYFKILAVWTPQDFKNKFGHFSTLWMEELISNECLKFTKYLILKLWMLESCLEE